MSTVPLVIGIELCVVVGRKYELALGLALKGLDVTLQQVYDLRVTHLLGVPSRRGIAPIYSFDEESSQELSAGGWSFPLNRRFKTHSFHCGI